MDSSAIAALIGAATGSLLTFSLGLFATKRQEHRKARMDVFTKLVAGRMRIAEQEVADVVNAVPIVFHNVPAVRRAYQHFCVSLAQPDFSHAIKSYNLMVIEIGKYLGFSNSIAEADLEIGHAVPQALAARAAGMIPR